MIIKYYNGYVNISKLEELLNITRNGTTAYHIVQTLKIIGFNAYGIKLEKLQKTKIPFIASVTIKSSYKHFIVVYEVTDKYIKIADPADKIKKLSTKEFYKIWNNINIQMYPIKIIPNERPKAIKEVLKLIKLNKVSILKIGCISIGVTVFSIMGSFFFQTLIESKNKNIIILFLIIFLFKIIITHIRNKMLINFTNHIDKILTQKVYKKIIKLPYRYYHNHTVGEIVSKINDIAILKDVLGKIILTIFIDFPLTILSGIILYRINNSLFSLSLLILISYIIILIIYNKKINKKIDIFLQTKANINSFMVESIKGFETIKGINIENKILNIFNQKYNHYIQKNIHLNNIVNNQNTLKDIIGTYGQALIIIAGLYLVNNHIINFSHLITYIILLSFFLEPIQNIVNLDFEIKKSLNSLYKILDLITYNKESNIKNLKGDIKLKNLRISLDDKHYILKNINILIKDKSKVLITGKSGSGKSTLLKIIKGYYQHEGQLLINKNKTTKNTNIIYISNNETLFTGTLNFNLRIKNSNNLKNIIKICHIEEIINANELKLNTLLEENGFNISTGQRQRIALARALHDFDILLIDEGLSGLDVNLERKILKNMFKQYKNKTIIVVSHRIDNLDLFNQYIKLNNGQIILDTSLPKREA